MELIVSLPGDSSIGDLSSLSPLAPQANQTADCTCDTDKSIVEVRKTNGGGWDHQVAEVRKELDAGSGAFPAFYIVSLLYQSKILTLKVHTSRASSPLQLLRLPSDPGSSASR